MMLSVDRGELARLVAALFCRADPDSFVSMRAFFDLKDGFALYSDWHTVRVSGYDDDITDAAEDLAQLAASDDEAIVFAPPIATFANRDRADEASLANGLVISAELDSNPEAGRQRLEDVLGPATIVMESGGWWIAPAPGSVKLGDRVQWTSGDYEFTTPLPVIWLSDDGAYARVDDVDKKTGARSMSGIPVAQLSRAIPKLHLHWRLAVPTRTRIEHDFLKEANKLATKLAGGDPSAVPLVHPLRWPGSWHKKAEPRLARIVDYHPEIEITLADALNQLRAAVKETDPPPAKGNGFDYAAPQADLFDLCAALAVIPNDDSDIPEGASWKQWNDMGLRIYAATAGSNAGEALFIEWSRRSTKFFNAAKTRVCWKRIAKSPPDRTNACAIFNMARAVWPGFVRPSEYARQARLAASLKEFESRQPEAGNVSPLVPANAKPRQCPPAMLREATFVRKPDWQDELLVTDKGGFRACLANAITALRTAPEWEDRLWFDAFHNRAVLRGVPPWSNSSFDDQPWADLFDNLVADWMQHQGIMVSHEIAGRAVWTVAHDQWFHPVRQYLEACRQAWDGQPRVETWTTRYLGTPDTPYSRAVGPRWLLSLIARVMEPGCKADCSLVLEGPQGILKSELLRRLGAPWVTDDLGGSEPGSKDAAIQTAGIWIFELPEIEQFTAGRDRDVARTKSYMSRSTDRFRPPYGRHAVPQPRQCGFACTTNKREYLPDETGNRRWWPISCTTIDLERLASERNQLFGETVALYEMGALWWLDTPELNALAADEQEDRYLSDALQDKIAEYIATLPSVSVAEILTHVLRLKDPGEWDQGKQSRIVKCLEKLGWQRGRQRTGGGKRPRRYFPPKKDADDPDDNE